MHAPRNSAEESVFKGLALFASLTMLMVSAYLNCRYMAKLAPSQTDAIAYGAVGIAADVLMGTLPFWLFPAIKRWQIVRALSIASLWVVCTAFSAQSAIGHIAGSRFEVLSGRTAAATSYQDTRAELKRLNERLGWLPKPADSEGSLRAKIKSHQSQPMWLNTQECANQWSKPAKDFCAKYTEMTSALTNTIEYDRVVIRIADLQAKSDAVGASHANILAEGADPQASTLGKWLGVDVTTMQGLLSMLGALMLLMGASLGPYAVLGGAVRPDDGPQTATSEPLALTTQDGRVIDITPSPPSGKPQVLLPPSRDVSPEARALMKAMGVPDKPCNKREKDTREVLGIRFYAWLVANGQTGEFSQDAIDGLYDVFSLADYKAPWGMRIVKTELAGLGERYVKSGPRTMEDGSRPTIWTVKPASLARLTIMLEKAGAISKDLPPAEPVAEEPAQEPPRNVFRLFGGRSDDEAKKATNG